MGAEQYFFGSGQMWAIPTLDIAGNNVATPTPIPFGALQEVSIDISQGKKELYGLYQFPLAVARGTGKIDLKAKFASINAQLFNLSFNDSIAANQMKAAYQEVGNISGNNCTVSAAANFAYDLGVVLASNGTPLTRVAANATALQYVVGANGLYTFNQANNVQVKISYMYNTNTGNVFTVQNRLLGVQPFFKVALRGEYDGKQFILEYLKCMSTKLGFGTKLEDFMIPEFDFSAMDDGTGNLFKVSAAV